MTTPDSESAGDVNQDNAEPSSTPKEAANLPPQQMARFVTSIKNPVQQTGEHVLRALQHEDTVAVLTTVVVGPGGQQHLVSAALNPLQTAQVNSLLQGAQQEREEEEICVGFHCLVKPRSPSEQEDVAKEES